MAVMILTALLLAATATGALEQSCDAGKGPACTELGNRLRDGFGVRQDPTRAAKMFKKACKLKDRDGCADDARALAAGEGQTASPDAGLRRLEQLCKARSVRACGNLGSLYFRGLGRPQDAARAED